MAHVEPGDAREEQRDHVRLRNLSDDDNRETDDPDFWEDGEDVDTCQWCGSTVCAHMDEDGNLVCCVTKRMIP